MEREILQTALDNLYQNTGIKGKFRSDDKMDGKLNLLIDGKEIPFLVEIKKGMRRHQLHQLGVYGRKYTNFMVVAEFIFPKLKEELREMNIAYLEANGNLFIKNKRVYLLIDTNKKAEVKKETANRAFTKTGLKILFHLLNDKDLINKTQREIADTVGVGLGNIPQVINGLKETGYLIQSTKQKYLWENRRELLDRWINDYAAELRPKLYRGNFTIKKKWQDIKLNTNHSVWGGEPAADKLTNYLRPGHFILHTNEKQKDLIKNYHIIPQITGELEVLEIFWKPQSDIAPPIIIYAELMLTGGKRNKETAEKIYHEYIQPIL